MKIKPTLRYSNLPLRVAEVRQSKDLINPFILLQAINISDRRFSVIENKSIQDAYNGDPTWYANYE